MIYLVWFLSLIATFCLGYFLRHTTERIKAIEESIKEKISIEEEEEPQSTLIDLTDPVQEAKWNHEQMMKKINNIQPDE